MVQRIAIALLGALVCASLVSIETASSVLIASKDWIVGFFDWLFARTRRRGRLIKRFELIGLILFVAIPLPVTGAWTGSLAAFLFGVKKRPPCPLFLPVSVSRASW